MSSIKKDEFSYIYADCTLATGHDELYKTSLFEETITNPATKEVQDYTFALKQGFQRARQSKLIRLSDILAIQQNLEHNTAGLRKLPGTDLKNARTGKVVYTPPQHADPLVKMAIIHHQLESIHPFYDGICSICPCYI